VIWREVLEGFAWGFGCGAFCVGGLALGFRLLFGAILSKDRGKRFWLNLFGSSIVLLQFGGAIAILYFTSRQAPLALAFGMLAAIFIGGGLLARRLE
jgi:hypothetical protein